MGAQEKSVFLKIEAINCNPCSDSGWISTIWCIYNDRSIERVEQFNLEGRIDDLLVLLEGRHHRRNIYSAGTVPRKIFESIQEIIDFEDWDHLDNQLNSFVDGTQWCIEQFDSDNEIKRRFDGYIYGHSVLEQIIRTIKSIKIKTLRTDIDIENKAIKGAIISLSELKFETKK